jgi:hypothetical protein
MHSSLCFCDAMLMASLGRLGSSYSADLLCVLLLMRFRSYRASAARGNAIFTPGQRSEARLKSDGSPRQDTAGAAVRPQGWDGVRIRGAGLPRTLQASRHDCHLKTRLARAMRASGQRGGAWEMPSWGDAGGGYSLMGTKHGSEPWLPTFVFFIAVPKRDHALTSRH